MRKKTKTRRKTNKRQVTHLIAFFTSLYAPLYCSFAEKSTARAVLFSVIFAAGELYCFAVIFAFGE